MKAISTTLNHYKKINKLNYMYKLCIIEDITQRKICHFNSLCNILIPVCVNYYTYVYMYIYRIVVSIFVIFVMCNHVPYLQNFSVIVEFFNVRRCLTKFFIKSFY